MTFSIQNNPYLSMYQQPPPPGSAADCALSRKAANFRQSLPSRLHGLPGLDLVNTILASYRANKAKSDPAPPPHLSYPPANPLLTSPGWFQQALVNSLLLPRPFVDDTCMPVPPIRPPDLAGLISPKIPRPIPPSPTTSKSRTSSCDSVMRMDKDATDPLLYCRPTFYPLLKDQVDRAHSSWRTSDAAPKSLNSEPVLETGTLVPSLIDGEVIMGFNVWGEKRLCLPHLFRFVLNDVDLKAIDEACTKLQITCTTCTPAQLKLLHARRILPKAVSTCGLIRKSDAERLTKYIRNRGDLTDRSQPVVRSNPTTSRSQCGTELDLAVTTASNKSTASTPIHSTSSCSKDARDDTPLDLVGDGESVRKRDTSVESQSHSNDEPIPVLHECFGRQSGLIHPSLYTEPTAKCIECQTCHRLFAPDQFVGHTHTVTEVDNLNHWGFDSNNWRCYLRLHTGRPGHVIRPSIGQTLMPPDGGSEDELENSPPKDCTISTETHRRLEEFKIKFAQPIRLPPSLSAALRTVGLCASVAPIPPTAMFPPHASLDLPDTHSTNAPNLSGKNPLFTTPQPLGLSRDLNNLPATAAPSTGPLPSPVPPGMSSPAPPIPPSIPSNLSSVLLPQLTLRRLWAPNDGRIKVPPPPKPNITRDQSVLPKKLHTGPPILLHSHRVVSQAAADQYDRDFIPNVCLMPPIGSKYRKSSCGSHSRHRQLSRDCCRHGGRYRHSRNLSSGSRSRSCSSGSSSSRTRSASVSSTTSSCYSRGRSCKRYCDAESHSPCSPRSRSSSTASSVHVDELESSDCPQKSRCRCNVGKSGSNASTVSDDTSSSDGYRRRSHHMRRVRRRYRSTSVPRNNVLVQCAPATRRRVRSASPTLFDTADELCIACRQIKPPPVSKTSTCSTTSCLKSVGSPAQSDQSGVNVSQQQPQRRRLHHCHRHHNHPPHQKRNRRQNRALAAAKAAQGAASRISPGLWSRHFTNLKANSGSTLELPNARQTIPTNVFNPSTALGRGPVPPNTGNTTPVLVTGPNTNSLPSAVLALESLWTDLVRHMNDFTSAVESRTGVPDARQRLFEQFLTMQTCYATHIAALMSENQKLHEKLASMSSPRSNPVTTEGKLPSKDSTQSMWSRTSYEPLRESAVRNTDQSQTKGSLTSQPVYPHRSRKEPQPMRTQFSTTVSPTTIPNTTVHTTSPVDRQGDRNITPDGWPKSSGSSDPTPSVTSPSVINSEPTARKVPRLSSVDRSASDRTPESNDSRWTPSAPSPKIPTVSTAATTEATNSSKPTSNAPIGPTVSESPVRLQPVHTSSAAPYKVSSGLCDRRLSERYNSERIPWKRRPWDMDLQTESNGTLDLSVQSTEPLQKRRALTVSDKSSFE